LKYKGSVVSAWIGLGSNMANPAARISGAIDRLGQEPQLTLERVSSFYRTAPLEYLEQADFINAVARVSTILGAEQLLERLVRIETELGRTRNGDRYGPRVIDLDLLLFSDIVLHNADEVPWNGRCSLLHRFSDRGKPCHPLSHYG